MIPGRFQGVERFGDIPEAQREARPRDIEGLGATEEVGWDLEQGDGGGRDHQGTTLMDGGSLPTTAFLLLLHLVGTSLRACCRLLCGAAAPTWHHKSPARLCPMHPAFISRSMEPWGHTRSRPPPGTGLWGRPGW